MEIYLGTNSLHLPTTEQDQGQELFLDILHQHSRCNFSSTFLIHPTPDGWTNSYIPVNSFAKGIMLTPCLLPFISNKTLFLSQK